MKKRDFFFKLCGPQLTLFQPGGGGPDYAPQIFGRCGVSESILWNCKDKNSNATSESFWPNRKFCFKRKPTNSDFVEWNLGCAKNISLSYNSNLTYFPPKRTNMYCNHIITKPVKWFLTKSCHLFLGVFFNGGRFFFKNPIDGRNIIWPTFCHYPPQNNNKTKAKTNKWQIFVTTMSLIFMRD